MIAHVDMDAFYASVEVLDQPGLKGRPVIVGGAKRGVVAAASYEARALGVHSAMPIFQAKRLCPHGVYIPPRMERYVQVSRGVMKVLSGFSPVLEQVSVDEAFLDLSGAARLWGSPEQTGSTIKEAVKNNTGLTCSVGLAPLRFLAKIASDRDKPDGLTVVEDVDIFLATVTLKEVSGVGIKARERLGAMGVTRLVELRALGAQRLKNIMGAFGMRLWELANGQDPGEVNPKREVKSVSNEMTLAWDSADRRELETKLLGLSQKVCRRLRHKGLNGKVVTLKLKHADMRLVTRRVSLAEGTDLVEEVFGAARELLWAYRVPGPFRLIGVGVSGLGSGAPVQAGLFNHESLKRSRALARAEDDICKRFGDKALSRAGALGALDREDKSKA